MAEADGGQDNGKSLWLLGLLAVGAGSGALVRYPHFGAEPGFLFALLVAIGLAVIGWPLLVGEAVLGNARRRNVVDAVRPGPWTALGYVYVGAAVLTLALLAVVAGWAGRLTLDSFSAGFTDDPARHFRLISAGSDALLATLLVLAAVVVTAMTTTKNGLSGTLRATAAGIGLVVAGLTVWAILHSGAGSGRREFLSLDFSQLSAALVVKAGLQALLPALVGLGIVATMSTRVEDRRLPNRAATLVLLLAVIPILVGLMASSLATAHGHTVASGSSIGDAFAGMAQLFGDLPEQRGGVFAGLFFGAMLAAALVAMVALLEVPVLWLYETFPGATPRRAYLAVSLVAALIAVPLAFGAGRVEALHLFLAGIVAPLAGLAISIHVGWIRPELLKGYRVGEGGTRLGKVLKPYLRFVAPPLLAVLFIAGLLVWLVDVGAMNHGTGGLWRIVP